MGWSNSMPAGVITAGSDTVHQQIFFRWDDCQSFRCPIVCQRDGAASTTNNTCQIPSNLSGLPPFARYGLEVWVKLPRGGNLRFSLGSLSALLQDEAEMVVRRRQVGAQLDRGAQVLLR